MTIDDKTKETLAADGLFGKSTIFALTLEPVAVLEPGASEPLTKEHLKDAKALVFLDIMKGGLGITYAKGHGYIICHLPDGKWSAPYFLKFQQFGVGVTAGLDNIQGIIVMHDEDNIKKIISGDGMKMGADLWITSAGTGGIGSSLGGAGWGQNKTLTKSPDKLWAIQLGYMAFNLAVNGTETSPDKDKNAKVYGDATPEAILAAGPLVPEVEVNFAPLYSTLAQL